MATASVRCNARAGRPRNGHGPVTPIDRYSLEPHSGPYESWPTTSILRVDGQRSAARAPGFQIEAQYATALGDLLITSYDCPFEESNSFVLVDASLRIRARAQLLVPYSTYLLHEHWPIDDVTLGLHYHEAVFYTLHVVPPGGWLRRKPRLRLRPRPAWKSDARMVEAYERLQAKLTDIAASRATWS